MTNNTTTGTTTVLCGYCQRPVLVGVWIADQMYHEECTHGPNYAPPNPVAEEIIRKMVREELAKAIPCHANKEKCFRSPDGYCAACHTSLYPGW